MSVLNRLRWTILACVMLGFFAYGIAEAAPIGMVLLLIAGGAGWWVTEGRPMRAARRAGADGPASVEDAAWQGLPRWVTNIALAFVILMAVLRGQGEGSIISAFASFLAAICVLKLWEKREPTDYGQLLTMSVFLAIGATLNSNALGVGAVIVLMVPCLVFAAFLYQLYSAQAVTRPVVAAGWASDAPAMSSSSHDVSLAKPTSRALNAWGSVVIASGFLLATLVFLFTPRGLGGGQLGQLGQLSPLRQTGFANEVDLTDGGLISESQMVVMTAKFSDSLGKTVGSSEEPQYLRGAILDEYRLGRWRSSSVDPPSRPAIPADAGSMAHLVDEPFESNFKVVIEPQTRTGKHDPVFHPWRATKLVFYGDNTATYDPRTGALTRTLSDGSGAYEVTYTLRSNPEDTESRRGEVAFDDPFVLEEARRILRMSDLSADPASRPVEQDAFAARVFEGYLRSNFEYSLNTPTPPLEQDPVAWFLRTKPPAHCEFFASALAALCRASGIDARVVAGYMTNEMEPQRGHYIVRASNAHAWVEVNTSPGSWRVFDGTPIASPIFQAQRRTSILGWLNAAVSGLDMLWNSTIVSYDDSSQRRVLGVHDIDSPVPLSAEAISRFPSVSMLRLRRIAGEISSNLGLAAGLLLVLGGGVAIVWSLLPRNARRIAGKSGWAFSGHDRLERLHQRTLAALAGVGAPKPDATPLSRHLRDVLHASGPDDATARAARELAPVADLLYTARFAGTSVEPGAIAHAESVVRSVASRRRERA